MAMNPPAMESLEVGQLVRLVNLQRVRQRQPGGVKVDGSIWCAAKHGSHAILAELNHVKSGLVGMNPDYIYTVYIYIYIYTYI